MALFQKVNSAPRWPSVASPANLPNVVGAPTQSSALEVGDTCWVTGSGLYVCTTATVGAAVWAPIATVAGQLGGTAIAPDVRGLRETSGPTLLTLGAVADGQFLQRSGTSLVGASAGLDAQARNALRLSTLYFASIGSVALKGLAWNGTTWVAVGNSGQCYTSPDGITWTSQTMPSAFGRLDVVWSSSLGLFVAVGDGAGSSTIVDTSANGVLWTSRVATGLPLAPALYSIATNGTTLVAVGSGGGTAQTVYTSTNAISWTVQTSIVTNNLFSVAWNPVSALFVAVGATGAIVTSPNGVTWTSRTSGTVNSLNGIAVNPTTGRMVAVGGNATMVTSADGIVWTAPDVVQNYTSNQFLVAYGDGGFIAGPFSNGNFWTSSDGIHWSAPYAIHGSYSASTGPVARNCGYANGRWVWVGNGAMYSNQVT